MSAGPYGWNAARWDATVRRLIGRRIPGGIRTIRQPKNRRRKSGRSASAAKRARARTRTGTTVLSDGCTSMADLVRLITATEPAVRNQSLEAACAGRSLSDLLEQCAALDAFRRRSENLYERVLALFFLYAIHRFHLPNRLAHALVAPKSDEGGSRITHHASHSLIPFKGYEHLLHRRF